MIETPLSTLVMGLNISSDRVMRYQSAKEYVRGRIHTNNIEGFWSLLKRGIGGVYHSVSEKYLQSYINEYGFRYNHRNDIKPMFLTVLSQVGKFS